MIDDLVLRDEEGKPLEYKPHPLEGGFDMRKAIGTTTFGSNLFGQIKWYLDDEEIKW